MQPRITFDHFLLNPQFSWNVALVKIIMFNLLPSITQITQLSE